MILFEEPVIVESYCICTWKVHIRIYYERHDDLNELYRGLMRNITYKLHNIISFEVFTNPTYTTYICLDVTLFLQLKSCRSYSLI